jgi:hypothetical protein
MQLEGGAFDQDTDATGEREVLELDQWKRPASIMGGSKERYFNAILPIRPQL